MRNEIKNIIALAANDIQNGDHVSLPSEEWADQILSLLEGSLPLEKGHDNYDSGVYKNTTAESEFDEGWNACLEAIKEKLQ